MALCLEYGTNSMSKFETHNIEEIMLGYECLVATDCVRKFCAKQIYIEMNHTCRLSEDMSPRSCHK